MISDLDESIRRLLIKEGGFDPAEVDVSFDLPNRPWSAGISKPTLNCYLADIRENAELRQQGLQAEKQVDGSTVRRRARSFYDLTYVVTAWTRAVEDEHRLLWHVLRTLTRFRTMPHEYLEGPLGAQDLPVRLRAAQASGVLTNPSEFWGAVDNQLKPSLTLLVTAGVDPELLAAGPPVFTAILRVGQLDASPSEVLWFGGVVRDGEGNPLAGADVEVEGHALSTRTEPDGRFRIKIPGPGHYTLLAHHGAVTRRTDVDIPTPSYDITL